MSTATITPPDTARSMWVQEVVRVGIVQARQAALVAVTGMEEAYAAKRTAEAELRLRADALTDEQGEADWQLGERFVVEGNKTWLITGDEKRAMTADKQKEWLKREIDKIPSVFAALTAHRQALTAAEAARDACVIAEKKVSACKYDLIAAGQMLETLATLTNCFNTKGGTA